MDATCDLRFIFLLVFIPNIERPYTFFFALRFELKLSYTQKKKQKKEKTKKIQEVKLKVAARYEKKKNKLFRIGKISVK